MMESNSWNILLIDDDPDDFVITKALLTETKGKAFDLHWASTYLDALQALDTEQVDAILMDYDLGEHNGVDLIRQVLSLGCQAPIILLTGRGSYEVDLEAMQAGAADYISKGEVNARLLERAIRYAIERKGTEKALATARDDLELRVQERTRELREANEQLAHTNTQLRQYALRSAALAEISQLLAEAGSEIQLILNTITRRVAETLGEACVLSLLSDDAQTIQTVAVHHTEPGGAAFIRAYLVENSRPVHEGLRAQVIQSGQPLLASNLPQDSFKANLPEERWPDLDRYGVHQLLLAPLRVQGQAIGTLGVSRGKDGKAYEPEDQTFLLNLADRAAQAIANARLFSALKNELAERIRVETQIQRSSQGVSIDVTERIRSQERISYQARLLENVNDAIIATDKELRLTAWNRAAEAIYGWKAEEVLERESYEVINTEIAGLTRAEAISRLMETGSFNGEVIQYHRSGRAIEIETKMIALMDEEGKLTGFVALNRDITERKRAEREIRQHAHRSEAVADLSRRLAEAGMSVNQVLDVIARRASELIGGFSLLMLLSPDGETLIPEAAYHPEPDALALLRSMNAKSQYLVSEQGLFARAVITGEAVLIPELPQNRALSGLNPFFYEYLERYGIYSILVVPLRAEGRVIGALGIARDYPGQPLTSDDQALLQNIADRAALAIYNARLFEALNKSEARFRAIFKESALGIKLSSPDGRILASNPALVDMLGYPETELIGMYFTDLTYAEDLPTNRKFFNQLVDGVISRYRVEKRYVRKDGGLVWVRQAVSMVKDEAGTPQFVVAISENINERKEMEDELAEVRRRLIDSREAERLYLSQEIHDGPMQELYGISFSLDMLQDDAAVDEVSETLGRMKVQLKETIQALRVICGQLRPPTLAPFGLEKTIRSYAEAFSSKHPEIELELDLQPDAQELPESIRLALFRIYQQSLANIMRHAGASRVKVRFQFDAENVTLQVEDNGKGFSLPERWVDLVRKGHYGLVGAAERAEGIGGRLDVDSQPGEGTLIRVVAPLN
jgi:PAS domain S-box-containing protein